MRVNADLVGRTYQASPYFVSAERIETFAHATGASHPGHVDPVAARALGYAAPFAPPTFAVVIAQRAEALYYEDPDAGVDFRYVVHAEESFEHHRPILAGDQIDAAVTVESVTERGSLTLVTTRCSLTRAGEEVADVVSTLAVRKATA